MEGNLYNEYSQKRKPASKTNVPCMFFQEVEGEEEKKEKTYIMTSSLICSCDFAVVSDLGVNTGLCRDGLRSSSPDRGNPTRTHFFIFSGCSGVWGTSGSSASFPCPCPCFLSSWLCPLQASWAPWACQLALMELASWAPQASWEPA